MVWGWIMIEQRETGTEARRLFFFNDDEGIKNWIWNYLKPICLQEHFYIDQNVVSISAIICGISSASRRRQSLFICFHFIQIRRRPNDEFKLFIL